MTEELLATVAVAIWTVALMDLRRTRRRRRAGE
jgi:hypothetical protein